MISEKKMKVSESIRNSLNIVEKQIRKSLVGYKINRLEIVPDEIMIELNITLNNIPCNISDISQMTIKQIVEEIFKEYREKK